MNDLLAYNSSTRAVAPGVVTSGVQLWRGLLGLAVGLAGLATSACGDDSSNSPSASAYTVSANQDDAEPQTDGSVQFTYTVTVTDSTGATVSGAGMKYEVSTGTITASNSISDANGTGKVRWTINAGEIASETSATLKACAESRVQAECTPTTVDNFDI